MEPEERKHPQAQDTDEKKEPVQFHLRMEPMNPEKSPAASPRKAAEEEVKVKPKPRVHPVILSGGSGTRLWPKSRALYPKQFHSLTSDYTLLQEALLRVKDETLYAPPLVICNEEHRFIVVEQAEELHIKLQDIVLEPEGRNTAPAVAVAALVTKKIDPNGLVLILASDHHIGDAKAFTDAVRLAVPAAAQGHICTFGITPTSPETGFGYIKRATEEVSAGCFKIEQFKEKPNLQTAEQYVADGSYVWNAGLFLFEVDRMISELNSFEPTIVPACLAALDEGERDPLGFTRLKKSEFAKSKATSVDYAVMERTTFSAVVPMAADWTDVGSWSSLHQTCVKKAWNSAENQRANLVTHGHVVHTDVKDSFLSTDGPLLTAIGVSNLSVIVTDDAVLVLPMDRAQDVGNLAKRLNQDPLTKHIAQKHLSVFNPWGHSKEISHGDNFRVLQLTVKPGCSTSLQLHFHRAMHQVVVKGTAAATRGEETLLLTENQSHYVPVGMKHRLLNIGNVPLVVMEVQSGPYLGSDDIVRLAEPLRPSSGTVLPEFRLPGPANTAKSTPPLDAPLPASSLVVPPSENAVRTLPSVPVEAEAKFVLSKTHEIRAALLFFAVGALSGSLPTLRGAQLKRYVIALIFAIGYACGKNQVLSNLLNLVRTWIK